MTDYKITIEVLLTDDIINKEEAWEVGEGLCRHIPTWEAKVVKVEKQEVK